MGRFQGGAGLCWLLAAPGLRSCHPPIKATSWGSAVPELLSTCSPAPPAPCSGSGGHLQSAAAVETLTSRNSFCGKLSSLLQDHEFPGRAWGRYQWGADLSPDREGGHQPLGLLGGSRLDPRSGEGPGSPGREGGGGRMGRGERWPDPSGSSRESA